MVAFLNNQDSTNTNVTNREKVKIDNIANLANSVATVIMQLPTFENKQFTIFESVENRDFWY